MSIEKVAKLAGVSNSTVSRVINNHPRIAPATRRVVEEAMQKLSYTPSERRPGPKPKAQRSANAQIGFFIVGISEGDSTPGFIDLIRGVSEGASDNNLALHFSHLPNPSELPELLGKHCFDGILLHGSPLEGAALERLRSIPAVWLMGNREKPAWGDQVMPDQIGIGELAAATLIGKGHERLCYINLDDQHWALRTYGALFAGSALSADHSVQMICNDKAEIPSYWRPYGSEPVAEVVERFIELDPRPTGVFVAGSMQAAIIQPALQQRGVEIGPNGVEMITCDNEVPYLFSLTPKPIAIDNKIEAIGRHGVHQLVWRMAHPAVSDQFQITVKPAIVPSA